MNQKHTPTPWMQGNFEAFGHAQPYADHVYDAMGNTIFQVVPANSSDDADALTATIVRACNAHEELLTIVKRYMQTGHSLRPVDMLNPSMDEDWVALLAAIAKAEGK